MSEQDLVNAILDWLRIHGAWAIRVNSGMRPFRDKDGVKRVIRGAPKGTPDILFCWPGGLFGVVEAKVYPNVPTPEQIATLQMIHDLGGLDIVAYSIDDVKEAVEAAINRA